MISAAIDTAYEHANFSYTARAIDPEGDALSYRFEEYAAWLSPLDSTISGIPPEGAKDTSFVVIASDGELNDTLKVFITVIPVNDPPKIISPAHVSAIEDSLFQYTAQAIDPEGDNITYVFKNYPRWMTPADATISGIPLEGTQDTSFMVIASDGQLHDSLLVQVTVIAINDPPQLISAAIDTAYEDMMFIYVAKAIDPENDKIYYSFINYPGWLTPSDSLISGIPGEGAKDTAFTVIASDNHLSDTLHVKIVVIPVNDPPQIVQLSDFIFENNDTYIIDLDTCVVDEDHTPESLTWKVNVADSNLKVILSDHIVSFSAPDWAGTTTAGFMVTDPEGASDSIRITITVILPSAVTANENIVPQEFFLGQNYPNPFNPQTTIHFGIPKASDVSISIYNVTGELVEQLFKGRRVPGNHQVIWDAKNYPSGIYLIRFQADRFVQVKKCLLMK